MPNDKDIIGRFSGATLDRDTSKREVRKRAVEDGRADIRAGRTVIPGEIDRWIDTVGTPDEQPVPQSRKR